MSGRQVRRADRRHMLQTAVFVAVVFVLALVLYLAFTVQSRERGQERLAETAGALPADSSHGPLIDATGGAAVTRVVLLAGTVSPASQPPAYPLLPPTPGHPVYPSPAEEGVPQIQTGLDMPIRSAYPATHTSPNPAAP